MLKEYYFNTGVRPFDHTPPAGMAFMPGYIDSGNGVYVIPFQCEEVPKGYKPVIAADNPDLYPEKEYIVRKVEPGSRLNSTYAYFELFANGNAGRNTQ